MDCANCGAEIEAADRYCPACRMPNMGCTRHPRFGPPERDPGPIISPRLMGPGENPCPRCSGGLRRGDRYCRSCGLDVAKLPVPEVVDPRRGRRLGAKGRPGDSYQPLGPSTAALRLVVGLIGLSGLVLAAVAVVVWRRLGGELPGLPLPDPTIAWAVLQTWVQGLAALQFVLLVLASVLMIRWTAQASRNISALRIGGRTIPSIWATFSWLIPVANLVLPKLILDELWRSSEPALPARSTRWRQATVPTGMNLWWICTLVTTPTLVLAGMELVRVGQLPPVAPADVSDARTAFLLVAMAELLLVFSAALFARVVGEITDRQAQRVAGLERVAGLAGPEDAVEAPAPGRASIFQPTGGSSRSRWVRRLSPTTHLVEPPPAPPQLVHVGGDRSPIGRY